MKASAANSHAASTTDIRGLLLDYGGTIDSRGIHWSEVIWDAYRACGPDVSKEDFRRAYVHAERALARTPVIIPTDNFRDLMEKKIAEELRFLAGNALIAPADIALSTPLAAYCYDRARECVLEALPVIERLHRRYPIALVSNFYGNLRTVIADFGLSGCFDAVIESAVVGVRKPDPAIFRLGAEALGLTPEQTLAVGDSYTKDIIPAGAAGCHTAWLKGKGWTDADDAHTAPCIITSLSDLTSVVAL